LNPSLCQLGPPVHLPVPSSSPLFLFNDPATTQLYTLSLHDALPISSGVEVGQHVRDGQPRALERQLRHDQVELVNGAVDFLQALDRKSTRLNSSHVKISYAVFCLKKKKNNKNEEMSVIWNVTNRMTA